MDRGWSDGGAFFFKGMEKRDLMAADVTVTVFEISFPRRYGIYFLKNNVVTEFQHYSEV